MNITVTFTDPGDFEVPDGMALVFEDVDLYEVSTPADVEEIDCAAAGCEGCEAVHRRFTGTSHLELRASGLCENGPRWLIPKAVTA
jgi:hypothetical protein